MKTTLTLFAVLIVLTAKAQTYKSVTTDHHDKAGNLTSQSVKYKSGSLSIHDSYIQVDTTRYDIVRTLSVDQADENYTTKEMLVIKGDKVYKCVELISPKGIITDIEFKKGNTFVSYEL